MDWPTYKRLCDQPDYWSRWMLEQCIDLLQQVEEAQLADRIRRALTDPPLPTPADHRGAAATHMYRLEMPAVERHALLGAIQRAAELNLSTKQTQQRGLGGFVEACREFALHEGGA